MKDGKKLILSGKLILFKNNLEPRKIKFILERDFKFFKEITLSIAKIFKNLSM